MPTNDPSFAWHAQDVDAVLERLETRDTGLEQVEANLRLQRYGPNRLPPPKRRGSWLRFLIQFHNVLIYVLIAAALVTALLGHWVDTGVIVAVVLINALVGFVQEGKAERALDAIRNLLSPHATVLRDRKQVVLPAEQVVPGDVVLLQPGDKVPADLRLIRVRDLRIEEAALTGESVPVDKTRGEVEEETVLGDRTSMAFASTLVTYGQGAGIVVGTGEDTEIGHISALLGKVHTLTTPLLRQISRFGRWLTAAILFMAACTSAYGILVWENPLSDMFLAAVGLAVAAIPEGLPAIITITLAIGVQRMAARNGIIRLLPAVETLGAVSVVCSDKTGTLTRNEMTVQTVASARNLFDVAGVGYNPHGGIRVNEEEIDPETRPGLMELARASLLCNDAEVNLDDGRWKLSGDPTEGALYTLALKCGLDPLFQKESLPRTDTIPFDSRHRFMATLHHDHAGHGFIYIKGAPERLVDRCAWQRIEGEDQPIDIGYWYRRVEEIARRGQRTLALAFRSAEPDHGELKFDHVEGGLTLLGLVGIIDPPRVEAIEAVKQCRSAGVTVKMITGDHAVTAHAVADQMGIGDGGSTLTGDEIEGSAEVELRDAVRNIDVFARTSPEHKLRLVEALQANGTVLAMTGDGVNDAPALKRADVGVAMGINGTEVAKESAEMVLADDNFASIVHAIEEGRTVYDNIKKSILFILPTNGAEAFTLIAAILLGYHLPITPVQILWVNMITAVTLALSLAFEPPETDIMNRPPRDPDEPILSGFLIWRTLFVSLLMVAGIFGLFLWEIDSGTSLDTARTVAVNTLVMFEVFYLLNTRYIRRSILSRKGLTGNRKVLVAIVLVVFFQFLFTYHPWMQQLFHTTPLDAKTWAVLVLVASSVFFVVELEKYFARYCSSRSKAISVK
ncbi:MAG: cation-transporting P-type ATPase [Pseudomonadota bacterium]|nr:cation-transporting P-type ATPase [Pseudomonadota bacterium]